MTVQDQVVDGEPQTPPDATPGRIERRRRARRQRRVSGIVYGVAVGALALTIPLLGVIGVRTILESSDGEVVDPVLDPTEPGYRALIQPSPTMLFVHEGEDGQMAGGALLSLAGTDGGGGSVVTFPPSILGDVPDIGELSVDAAYGFSGADAALSTARWVLHLGIDDVVVMDDAQLAEMFAASGPLTIENPDTIRLDDGTTFPAGSLILEPEEIPRFIAHVGDEESRLNRVLRQQLVWNAWIEQVAANGSVDFPGEQDSGLARFVTGIAEGEHRVESVPLVSDPDAEESGSTDAFELDAEQWGAMVADLIPFPTGAGEGDRPIVRVLAGTPDADALRPAARRIVVGGGQVDMIGNADELDQETTQIIYYDRANRDAAEAVAAALGFGTVTKVDEIDDTVDVVVVLGADADL